MVEVIFARRRAIHPVIVAVLGLVAALTTAGCATAPAPRPSSAPDQAPQVRVAPPAPATDAELDAIAALLRLEDRREFDRAALDRAAQATSARVRQRAALTLARLRRPEGAPLLLRLLLDADTSVAAMSAFALGQLGDSTHTPALAATLLGERRAGRETVAAEAAYALGKVGGTAARDALADFLGDATAPPGADVPVVESALLAIWRLPSLPDIAPIARWLEVDDPAIRWRATYALARRADSRAFTLLRDALVDPEPQVRSLAMRGMTRALTDSAGVPHLTIITEIAPFLADSSYGVAIAAARALGSFTEAAAVEPLLAATRAPSTHLAIAALEALGRIASTVRVLPTPPGGADPGPLGGRAGEIESIVVADTLPVAVRASALDALTEISPEAAGRVGERLAGSPSWRLRAAAARAIVRESGVGGTTFRALLDDPVVMVGGAALQAAIDAAEDDPSAIRPLLIERLGAADAVTRSIALTALAELEDPALLPLLLDAYDRARADTLNDAALAAVDAIASVAREGTRPERAFLARFPRSPDALVRLRAVARLDSTAVVEAWGPALPIETGRTAADYRTIVDSLVAPRLAGDSLPVVALITRGDTLRLEMFAALAPLTVNSFMTLARAGYFDGQEWPRVVGDFVVQGGDPRGDTSGGPGYTIRDEINRVRYGVGTLGMALAGPDTGGSQFFITHSPQPHLDGTYTIFGRVIGDGSLSRTILPGDTIDRILIMP